MTHSFPTRRSSDLARNQIGQALDRSAASLGLGHHLHDAGEHGLRADLQGLHDERARLIERAADHLVAWRSEEHTSELQSLMRSSYAVFCLKKTNHVHEVPTRHRQQLASHEE